MATTAAIDFLKVQFKSLKPSFLSKQPHFNFISAHYFYIIGQSLLGSILLYASGSGNIAYIDALLFGSGAATQSGLNPVDVNLLNTFQQAVLYLVAMMCSPITINTFVVFLRLYWFEKKFQDLVKEAWSRRTTFAQSRSKARNDDHQSRDVELGVNGRDIRVVRGEQNGRVTNDGLLLTPISPRQPNGLPITTPMTNGRSTHPNAETRTPEIKFSHVVKRSDGIDDDVVKLPQMRSTEEHLAILERQRNENLETLRIPGPRDVERGMEPVAVDRSETDAPEPLSPRARSHSMGEELRAQPRQQTIMIQEPTKPQTRDDIAEEFEAIKNTLSPFKFRIPRIFKNKNPKYHQDDSDDEQERGRGMSRSSRRPTFSTIRKTFKNENVEGTPYLSWTPTIGRNSAFPGMSEEQREEVGGVEYRSLKSLAKVLVCYFVLFSILGFVCLTPWIVSVNQYGQVVDAAGQSRVWWGFFTANSAFMDLGFTLTPDSMISFNSATFPLIFMSFLIIIGNTGFPILLRFIIWLMSLMVPKHSGLWEELRFLLDHPRRCFTLLFPATATWWLFWLLVGLNGLDLIFFIVLDLGSGPVELMPTGMKILNGVFQAASTRTAGFSSVNLAELHPGVLTSYLIMMYISIFPIAISVRRTNVYEESALGIYGSAEEDQPGTDMSHVGSHLRRQLSFDLWFIFLGFFILSITEGDRLQRGDFTMFAVLFEIVSAYGTVGMSLGYTGVNTSLVAQFTVVGKLVVIAMQIRGRHRGLPYGLDRAVLLPGDARNVNEEAKEADAPAVQPLMHRRDSALSTATDVYGPGGFRRRDRSRSSMRRVNSNVLVQLLHPGPTHSHGMPPPPTRRRSVSDMDEELDDRDRSRSRTVRRTVTTAQLPIRSTGTPTGH